MSSQPLDGTISGVDHRRFNRASVQLQLEFPKSPEIISDLLDISDFRDRDHCLFRILRTIEALKAERG
jgi:hypothetical protein